MTRITTYKQQLAHLSQPEHKGEKVQFAVYLEEHYGVPRYNSHRNVQRGSWEEWKCQGIIGCVADFLGRPDITAIEQVYDWFNALPCQNVPSGNKPAYPVKMLFYEYMRQRGACRDTVSRRLRDRDYTAFEAKGVKVIYDEFRQLQRKG